MMMQILAILAAAGAVQADARPQDDAELGRLKSETWPAIYRELDAAALDAFLDDRFLMLGAEGAVTTKAEELSWMRQAETSGQPEDFRFTIEDILYIGENAAIVFGEGASTRTTADGRPCAHSYHSSNTFIREDARWRPVFSHVSGARCTPIDAEE
ncbi:MAG: nuclear transport factor 2 family protein [Oceanicaulis sp.]